MKLADVWLLQPAASLFASFTSTEIAGAHQKEKSLEEKEARKDPTALDTWQLYHFEDSPCSKTEHYTGTYNHGKISGKLVNWIYHGLEAFLMLSCPAQVYRNPSGTKLKFNKWHPRSHPFRDLHLHPSCTLKPLWQFNRHHHPCPPAVFSGCFCSLRQPQSNPTYLSLPGHSPPSLQVLNHPVPVWPRQGQASFSTCPGNRRCHNSWLKARDNSSYYRYIEQSYSVRASKEKRWEAPSTLHLKTENLVRGQCAKPWPRQLKHQPHSFKRQ